MRPADGSELSITPPNAVDDANFKKLVAIIRIAVPYTGMILSTRESPEMRAQLLKVRERMESMLGESGGLSASFSSSHPPHVYPPFMTWAQVGMSQMSAGSKTDVGAYHRDHTEATEKNLGDLAGQFSLQDHRWGLQCAGGS